MDFKFKRLSVSCLLLALCNNYSFALPIDWSGVFGVDNHLINNTCRTKDNNPNPGPNSGSMGINGDCATSFQTYILKLNPHILINDGASLKAELSSGFARGNFAGSEATNAGDSTNTNNSYFFVTPAQNSALNVNQIYMELYADTALVKMGRFSKHYGLGAIFNDGNEAWKRFFTMYDGIEAEMKISNFSLIPYWSKISTLDTADAVKASGEADVKETGVSAKYDNKNKDLVVSILYAKRFSERNNTLYENKSEVTIIDPYVSKKWNKFFIQAEAPMLSGKIGQYGANTPEDSKISAKSYLVEATYDLNPKWELGFNGGQVSGDKGSSDTFEATYLHPNYQIAELMFRYHFQSFNGANDNIFNSSIANTRYFNLYAKYKSDKWTWKGSLITATAMETASANSKAFHHEENYRFDSTANQDNSLGHEIDLSFDYQWNPNVLISGYYGYWMLGDYFAFSNSTNAIKTADVHGGGIRATLDF